MEVVKIIAVGLITAFASLIVKQFKPEISVLINVAGGIMLVIMSIDAIGNVFFSFRSIFEKTSISSKVLTPILKIIAVGYLCEFSANICADSGSSALGDKIMFGGKVIILLLSLPIINQVFEIIMDLL